MPEGNNLLIYSFSLSFSCEKCHCNIPVVVEDNSMQTEQDPDMASTIRTAVQWANRVVNQQGEDIQCIESTGWKQKTRNNTSGGQCNTWKKA